MTLEKLTRAQFAADMGYVGSDGRASARAIAQLLRGALGRWGLCPRRQLLKYAREQLRAGNVEVDIVPDVLDRLLALRECAEVFIGHETYVAPGERRWVAVGEREAALLGPGRPPAAVQQLPGVQHDDIVVRVWVRSEEEAAMLEADGVHQVSLWDWFHPSGHVLHATRRLAGPVRGDRLGLVAFWELLEQALAVDGLPLGPDAEVRVLAGSAGGFFGNHTALATEGRWTTAPPQGVWCAYRRGHGEARWLPILIAIHEHDRRCLDLFDDDEWRWALLARSYAIGPPEVVRRTDGEELVTWRLPAQLRAAMDLRGRPSGPWRWRVADDVPDIWALLR